MWPWIKKEKVESMLQVMPIDIAAEKLNVSKWMLYKYTSYHKIDVWKCKEALKEKRAQRAKLKTVDKYYNIVYGYLTQNVLNNLKFKYTVKQLCWLFKIDTTDLLRKAQSWNIILIQRKNHGVCSKCQTVGQLYDGVCIVCKTKLNDQGIVVAPQTELAVDIIKLRAVGKSYNQIARELDCSKATVSYYCSTATKTNCEKKRIWYCKTLNGKLSKRWTQFTRQTPRNNIKQICLDWNKKFRTAASKFRNRNNMKETYNYTKLLEHVGGMHTHCYLTGIPINIETDDFQLDHIIPASKGGTNDISNCGITIPIANKMKTDMTVSELLEMCEKILTHHNYKVEKPST